jgi:hypothetical protein
MKRFALLLLLLPALFAAAPLTAGAAQPRFTTIVVNHFTNASGVNAPQKYIQEFSEGFSESLRHAKSAGQVVQQGATVPDADAANSLVIEGKFTNLDIGGVFTNLGMEFEVYRISDHVLVKTISKHAKYAHVGDLANSMGYTVMGPAVASALKTVNLSSIPAGPPAPKPAAPASASAAAPPATPVLASIQFSSNPTGAEITIDGAYAGNTPCLIKLRPGTHSLKITKNGYAPWERTIEPGAGEARSVAATLEKNSP